MKVVIPVASGTEELEAVTIADVLRRAGIHVVMLSIDDEGGIDIDCAHGVGLVADEMWNSEEVDDADMLVLPGGLGGMEAFCDDRRVLDAVRRFAQSSDRYVAAICASPVALHAAGVLAGRRAVCYPGMEGRIPDAVYCPDEDVVRDGNIITSRGPATAMKFALFLVEVLAGRKTAEEVASGLLCRL